MMVAALQEKFGTVWGTDIEDYGAGFPVCDFLGLGDEVLKVVGAPTIDYIVTNPPFNKAEEFFHHWHDNLESVQHLCLLLRTSWLEGWSRFDNIFSAGKAPAYVCPYVGRVPMVQGRL